MSHQNTTSQTSSGNTQTLTDMEHQNTASQRSSGLSRLCKLQYDDKTDTVTDARSVLLVVAALIATVTFQAGVDPPGGVWQVSNDENRAGTAVYASQNNIFFVFLVANTFAFSSAILVILSLVYRFPLRFEISVATIAMIITYGSSIFAISPDDYRKFRYILIAAAVPFLVRLVAEVYIKYVGAKNDKCCFGWVGNVCKSINITCHDGN